MSIWKNVFIVTAATASLATSASISIDPTATAQKVVGFGGGVVYYQDWFTAMSAESKEALYDTAFTGLNLSLLRLGNWMQEDSKDISADVEIVKAAKDRLGDHLKIQMSSWTAPANLKPSGDVNGSPTQSDNDKYPRKSATLNTSTSDPYGKYAYTDFANWWKKSYQAYAAAGINIDYISLQNEPDMFAAYAETLFDATENDSTAGYAEALNAIYDAMKSLPNAPKILGPEPLGIGYNNFQKYMNELDTNKLDGYAYHLYHAGDGNDNSLNNYMNPENYRKPMSEIANSYYSESKPIIMTEFCTMADNGKEIYMVGLAHIMQVGFTAGKLGGYIAWELMWGNGVGQVIGVCAKGWGNCTEDAFTISPEYHAMRHYSKFVNPGWSVVSATVTDASNLYVVAFRSADEDSLTIVAVNKNEAATELTSMDVKTYIALDAVQSVENGEKSKKIALANSYTLPAKSITTFVFSGESNKVIPAEIHLNSNATSPISQVFDLQGNLLWTGKLTNAELMDGVLHLQNLNAGLYLVRNGSKTITAVKK